MEFQFHTGSIKSYRRNTILITFYDRFNSILVRLKVQAFLRRTQTSICFNSILVRLKE